MKLTVRWLGSMSGLKTRKHRTCHEDGKPVTASRGMQMQ